MKQLPEPCRISQVCQALLGSTERSATCYVDARHVVRATWRLKPSSRNRREEMLVTFGEPNFSERAFIKKCGTVPSGVVQLHKWPRKRASRKGE